MVDMRLRNILDCMLRQRGTSLTSDRLSMSYMTMVTPVLMLAMNATESIVENLLKGTFSLKFMLILIKTYAT